MRVGRSLSTRGEEDEVGGAESSKSADKETSLNETRKRRSIRAAGVQVRYELHKDMRRKDKRVKKRKKKLL